jgi:peptidoglycan hydrolase CwlO-like protein
MINLEFFTKNRLFLISIGLWVLILFVMITCNTHRSTDDKKLMKSITQQQDSLKEVLKGREKEIDDLTKVIKATEMKLDTINFTNDILNKKITQYEKNRISIIGGSVDSNLSYLTDQLAKESNNR